MIEEAGLIKENGVIKESEPEKETDRYIESDRIKLSDQIQNKPLDQIKNLKKYIVAALSRKAENIVILNVHELTSYTDYLIIMTGRSARQVSSMAEYIYKSMKDMGNAPIGFEGIKEGRWALIDFGDVIVHIFDEETRTLYNIEGLWSDALEIDLLEFDLKIRQDDNIEKDKEDYNDRD